jgi:hypothetical protein
MREMMRLIATLTIWVVFATVMGVTMTNATGPIAKANGGEIIGIVALMAAAATISTVVIWYGTNRPETRDSSVNVARSKIKRVERDRVERLIDTLNEDEIYDLEALLLARREDSGHNS